MSDPDIANNKRAIEDDYTMQDFLREIASDLIFEYKHTVKEAYDTDIFRYLDLLAIQLKKNRERYGEKKQYIDELAWLYRSLVSSFF